jgi:hypothetical protein
LSAVEGDRVGACCRAFEIESTCRQAQTLTDSGTKHRQGQAETCVFLSAPDILLKSFSSGRMRSSLSLITAPRNFRSRYILDVSYALHTFCCACMCKFACIDTQRHAASGQGVWLYVDYQSSGARDCPAAPRMWIAPCQNQKHRCERKTVRARASVALVGGRTRGGQECWAGCFARPEDGLNRGKQARGVANEVCEDKLEARAVEFRQDIQRLGIALETALGGAYVDVYH